MKRFLTVIKKSIAVFALICMLIPALTGMAYAQEKDLDIKSESAMLYCVQSDTILYSKNAEKSMRPGVLTKLMVAVVALEEAENRGLSLDGLVTASRKAISSARGKHISMKTGEQFRLRDLIACIIHLDADDAAYVIAESIADSEENFLKLMNNKALELGMTDTVYNSVSATYDEVSTTTAQDQLKLGSYALQLLPLTEIAAYYRVEISETNKSGARYYGTTNYLLSTRVNGDYYLSSAIGLLCGTNGEAGYCGILVTQKNGLNYVSVVMGSTDQRVLVSPERTETDADGNSVTFPAEYKTIFHGLNDARALLVYGETSFRYIKAVNAATPITEIPVKLGSGNDKVVVLPEHDFELFVSNETDKEKEIKYSYTLDVKELVAPVKPGERVGTLYVEYQGKIIAEVPLVTKSSVELDGYQVLIKRVKELVSTPFFVILILLTLFAAVFYVFSTAVNRQKHIDKIKKEADKSNRYLNRPKDQSKK